MSTFAKQNRPANTEYTVELKMADKKTGMTESGIYRIHCAAALPEPKAAYVIKTAMDEANGTEYPNMLRTVVKILEGKGVYAQKLQPNFTVSHGC